MEKKGEGEELTGTKDTEMARKDVIKPEGEGTLHLFLFGFVFLVEEECSEETGCAGRWAFLSSCGGSFWISPWPGDAETVDQTGTLFVQPECCVQNSSPTKITVFPMQ